MEFDEQFLQDSSAITPSELKLSKQKLVTTVPRDGTKWKTMLLRFTNLLFVLFKGECLLYIKMLDIAKALHKYPSDVLDALPVHTKVSVLWIIYLQAQHFAQGKMKLASPSTMCLPAFKLMFNQICSTAVHMVSIAELPACLEIPTTTTKQKLNSSKDTLHVDDQPDPKKPKPNKEKKESPWNNKLKAALEEPLHIAVLTIATSLEMMLSFLIPARMIVANGCSLENAVLARSVVQPYHCF